MIYSLCIAGEDDEVSSTTRSTSRKEVEGAFVQLYTVLDFVSPRPLLAGLTRERSPSLDRALDYDNSTWEPDGGLLPQEDEGTFSGW